MKMEGAEAGLAGGKMKLRNWQIFGEQWSAHKMKAGTLLCIPYNRGVVQCLEPSNRAFDGSDLFRAIHCREEILTVGYTIQRLGSLGNGDHKSKS